MSHLLTAGILQQARNLAGGKQYALSFDGVDGYAMIMESLILDGIKDSFRVVIKSKYPSASLYETFFGFGNSQPALLFRNLTTASEGAIHSGPGSLTGIPSIDLPADGDWHIYDISLSGGMLTISIDGVEIASQSQGADELSIQDYISISAWLSRDIGMVWFKQQEVEYFKIWKDFAMTEPFMILDMNEGSGNTLFDSSENNRNMTVYGSNNIWKKL